MKNEQKAINLCGELADVLTPLEEKHSYLQRGVDVSVSVPVELLYRAREINDAATENLKPLSPTDLEAFKAHVRGKLREMEPCPSVEFAERELASRLALPVDDPDRWMAEHLMDMVRLFALEGHSGFSAAYAVAGLEKLLRQEPLGPLTGEEDEWTFLGYSPEMYAQNKRCSHVFRREDGTAYDSEGRVFREPSGACYTGKGSRVDVTFPYTPVREYVDVPADEE